MKRPRLSWFAMPLLFLFFQGQLMAQFTSDCTNCPLDFMSNAVNQVVTSEIEVPDMGSNDLTTMPLISVCFDITHSWVGDLYIVLESPGGKSYFLMGDDNNSSGGCGSPASNVNVCFIPGSDNPLGNGSSYDVYCNDPSNCLIGDWTVGCGPSMISDLTPQASAAPNCDLLDFNVAGDPVGGTWRALFGCVCGAGEGATLNSWSLTFQDNSLQPCPGPPTTTANLAAQPCDGDNLVMNAMGGSSYSWSGPNGFSSTEPILQLPGFSGSLAGLYTCTITTDEECLDIHEVMVEDVCEVQEVSLQKDLSQEICFDELTSAEFCDSGSSAVLGLEVNGNCITLTGMNPGAGKVCVWEKINDEEIFHRFEVDIPVPVYTWPGDMNFDGEVNHIDPLYLGLAFGQNGYPRADASSDWTAQYAPDWDAGTPISTVNSKHSDTNGDGTVDLLDLLLTTINWGDSHNDGTNTGLPSGSVPAGMAASVWLEIEPLELGASYELPLHLGTEDLPVNNMNGLAFTITSAAFEAMENLQLEPHGELLGELGIDWTYAVKYKNEDIFVAITRLGSSPISGHGQIGTLRFALPDGLPVGSEITFATAADFCMSGDEFPCVTSPHEQTASIVSSAAEAFPAEWRISPNPAGGQAVLATPGTAPLSVDIVDLKGVVREKIPAQMGQTHMNLGHLPNGLYLVRVKTKDKIFFQRLALID